MAKGLTTKLYEGKFSLFEVTLGIFDTDDGLTPLPKILVVGTVKSLKDYIGNYLVPSLVDGKRRAYWTSQTFSTEFRRGKRVEGAYVPTYNCNKPIDIIAAPMSTQAT